MSDANQDSTSEALNVSIPKSEKPRKFDGTEFKRSQQNMLFYLTTLHLIKFLKEDPSEHGTDRDFVLAVDA